MLKDKEKTTQVLQIVSLITRETRGPLQRPTREQTTKQGQNRSPHTKDSLWLRKPEKSSEVKQLQDKTLVQATQVWGQATTRKEKIYW